MMPKLCFNNTTILIILIIVVFATCIFLNSGIIENFDSYNCADRLYFDGNKYYLFRMNMPIIKDVNPLIYKTYDEYIKNKPTECPELNITKPYQKKYSHKKLNPVLPYEWECEREIANDTSLQVNCVNKNYKYFTPEECKLFANKPHQFYVNNAINRCMTRNLIKEQPVLFDGENIGAIEFHEEGLVRVGADLGINPFTNTP